MGMFRDLKKLSDQCRERRKQQARLTTGQEMPKGTSDVTIQARRRPRGLVAE